MNRRGPMDIAIVGMACRFPGASDLFAFWKNILEGFDATSEVPEDRWDPAVFFDPDSTANDRVPCRRGGYLASPIPFDPASHGIMPNAVDGGEPEQFLILDAARSALADAGLAGGVPDGRKVEVVVGRGNYFNRGNLTRLQHGRVVAQTMAILESLHPEWSEADREAVRLDLKGSLPPFGPATIPGQVTNATAGRVANRFDLRGASFVVDAASASSLVALDLGARALVERRADLAIVGGVYLEADVDFPLVFRQIGALSRSGRARPFSTDADGTVSGEGVGVVVLKRRLDAERDGDRLYALIQGVGMASDGRGLGLASPSARGHARAIRLAYKRSGIDPASVGLIEGHGLGVPSADRAEIRALRAVFPPIGAGRRALGAVSSMIGHAMPAAGMAGLIKTALSLHHRVLPPTLHAEHPHPLLDRPDSPATLNARPRPWIQGDPASPRRAGVNAFGFAGINAHCVLEEHPASADGVGPGAMLAWDSEAILITAEDREGLVDRCRRLLAWLRADPPACLKDLAFTLNSAEIDQPARLGLVATSLVDLASKLEVAMARLETPACRSIRDARGIYFWERSPGDRPKLAFLFPGEGSQYPGMLADLCPHFPEVRALFDTSDRIARAAGAATWPSEHLFGGGSGNLWAADLAVNVVLSSQWALYQLLSGLKIRPDGVVGHSSGELLALAASGAIAVDRAFEDQLGDLGSIFGRLETSGTLPTARLVAVASDRSKVEAALAESGWPVDLAMDNCPHQVVLAGSPEAVEAVVGRLKAKGMVCEDLPFARAYHTSSFAPAMGPLVTFFDALSLSGPRIPIYSCSTERRMPADPSEIREVAVGQWTRAVRFRGTIEAMHADGFTDFVEVGARGNLSGFVEDTLRGRPAFSVAANLPRRSGLAQLNHLVASLHARGVALDPGLLYARRRPIRVDLHRPTRAATPAPSLAVGFPEMRLSGAIIDRLRTERAGQARAFAVPASADFQRTMDAFLETQRSVLEAFSGVKEMMPERPGRPGPWSGELVSIEANRSAVSRLILDIEGDPVAEHHTLGGRRISALNGEWRGLPVLPFSVMAEMLAEAASRLVPSGLLVGLRDVLAHKWIRYEAGPVTLEIMAEVDPARSNEVSVSIFNRGMAGAPRPAENAVFEGVAIFSECRPEPIVPPSFHLENAEACRFTPDTIYAEQWLFHGPALQAVVGIGSIAMGGIEGTLRVLPMGPLLGDPDLASGMMTDPIILDNFTHLLGGWGLDRLADDGDVIFPLRMGDLAIFGERPREGSDVSCRISIRELERHRVKVDADILRPDGSTWMAIRGWEDWRFRWPGRYRDGFRQPDRTLLGEPLTMSGQPAGTRAVWLEPPGDMGRPVWRDVLEHVQMGQDERSSYLAMPGPDFRRTHRLWGRIAAKEAARRLWLEDGDSPVYPADLIIDRDPLGRPTLRSRLQPARAMPAISIGHVDGVAVAIASIHSQIGIDVEPIVDRSPGFEATAFTPGERALLGSRSARERAEWVARLWTCKEATAKATGQGFVDGPSGVEIVAIEPDGSMAAKLRGGLALACPAMAGRAIRVVPERRGEHVWAWTLGERIDR